MLGGADGYLAKALPALELVAAMEKVHAGERIVALDLPSGVTGRRRRPDIGLTPRESARGVADRGRSAEQGDRPALGCR